MSLYIYTRYINCNSQNKNSLYKIMSQQVSGIIKQKDPYLSYTADTCDQGDWQVKTQSRGNKAPLAVCSKPDPKICPVIGGQQASVAFQGPPNVACSYDVSAFKTEQDITKWKKAFGMTDSFEQNIMPAFCSGTTKEKCKKRDSGTKPTTCSWFSSSSDGGKMCQDWAKRSPDGMSAAQETFCKNNPNMPECACINRESNDVYQVLKPLAGDANDGCWFKPCQDKNNFIPAELTKQEPCNDVCNAFDGQVNNEALNEMTICENPTTTSSGGIMWILGLIVLFIIFVIIIGIIIWVTK
jgi:hypothetical protein